MNFDRSVSENLEFNLSKQQQAIDWPDCGYAAEFSSADALHCLISAHL
jgi:hypothetical protein